MSLNRDVACKDESKDLSGLSVHSKDKIVGQDAAGTRWRPNA